MLVSNALNAYSTIIETICQRWGDVIRPVGGLLVTEVAGGGVGGSVLSDPCSCLVTLTQTSVG